MLTSVFVLSNFVVYSIHNINSTAPLNAINKVAFTQE